MSEHVILIISVAFGVVGGVAFALDLADVSSRLPVPTSIRAIVGILVGLVAGAALGALASLALGLSQKTADVGQNGGNQLNEAFKPYDH